jgi:hypothetical protein
MPIGFLEAPFAAYSKSLYIGISTMPGPFHVQPQIEVEFIIEKMNVAVAEHTEERTSGLEILGVNNAILDGEFCVCFVGDAVSAAGHDVVQIPDSGPKIGIAKTSPLLTSIFPFALASFANYCPGR